jgi:hypothetical protein
MPSGLTIDEMRSGMGAKLPKGATFAAQEGIPALPRKCYDKMSVNCRLEGGIRIDG